MKPLEQVSVFEVRCKDEWVPALLSQLEPWDIIRVKTDSTQTEWDVNDDGEGEFLVMESPVVRLFGLQAFRTQAVGSMFTIKKEPT